MATIFENLTASLGREPSAEELQMEIARQAKDWNDWKAANYKKSAKVSKRAPREKSARKKLTGIL